MKSYLDKRYLELERFYKSRSLGPTILYAMNYRIFSPLPISIGGVFTPKRKAWNCCLQSNEKLFESLWDLIPPTLTVTEIRTRWYEDELVFYNQKLIGINYLYRVPKYDFFVAGLFKNRKVVFHFNELEEFFDPIGLVISPIIGSCLYDLWEIPDLGDSDKKSM